MLKKNLALTAAIVWAVAVLSTPVMTNAAKAKSVAKVFNDGRAKCYECHDDVKTLKEGSKHAKLACTTWD
jgi:nitrite reductase (cytochrome c-552)